MDVVDSYQQSKDGVDWDRRWANHDWPYIRCADAIRKGGRISYHAHLVWSTTARSCRTRRIWGLVLRYVRDNFDWISFLPMVKKHLLMEMKPTCTKFVSTHRLLMKRVTKWQTKHRALSISYLDEKNHVCKPTLDSWIVILCFDSVATILSTTCLQGPTHYWVNMWLNSKN